jgi:hypothetical protein
MAKNKTNLQRHQKQIQNAHGQVQLSNEEIQDKLRDQIISECKEIARGTKVSIYELIEMTKELVALELPEEPQALEF